MHRRLVTRRVAATSRDKRSFLSPFIIGLGIWIGFPTVAAYQDMASLVSGIEAPSARWNAFVEKSAAGSVHAAEMPFVDAESRPPRFRDPASPPRTSAKVSLRGKSGVANEIPDEDRIVRSGKKGRIVHVAPVAPPKTFDAGSIFKRTGLLHAARQQDNVKMAFAKPEIHGKEIEIATAFYKKKAEARSRRAGDAGKPGHQREGRRAGDRLCAAGAGLCPPSPFDRACCGGQDTAAVSSRARQGRSRLDGNPLPAERVFAKAEQKCLASGIYFESRGEIAEGQAAVAQVILNRVRNPAYPDTICGVVYQNKGWHNRCQFSFACDGIKAEIVWSRTTRPPRRSPWR